MSKTVSGKLAREYCTKHPSAPTRSVASMLMRDAPEVFNDYEHARTMVRSARGENGKKARKSPSRVATTKQSFTMPASDAKPVEPTMLDVKGRGMIAGDWHIPYHDQKACELAVNHAISKGHTDYLIINGDFLDCYQLSRWEKDPRKRRFSEELAIARETLDALCDVFDKVVYKLGNHEVRYESYLRNKASELLGVPEFALRSLLKLDDKGVQLVDANKVMQLGRLNIIHGHEMPSGVASPVNPARGLFLRAKTSAICSHFHQTSQHTEGDLRRHQTSCWSLGCLCELAPDYAPVNKWNHGAALLDYRNDGFLVDNFRIHNGKIL